MKRGKMKGENKQSSIAEILVIISTFAQRNPEKEKKQKKKNHLK